MKRMTLGTAITALVLSGWAQEANRLAHVDAEGVLRWTDDASEVALVGVNYYAPFSVDYAELERLGVDPKQTIRDDVAHFRRLGLGCIRLHCFDREFSDTEGHFIDNRHVELLDFLIDECRRNGLYTVLTPIAWWGGHYAPGTLHGFSDLYEMRQMTTDRQAWALQARFLKAFGEHVNRYTGKRYADDPAVLAFECINEPLYPKDTPDSVVTDYINTLADALRASGTAKPIYYNSWQGRNAAAAAARIDGVTGSNYPTGLASGRALKTPQLNHARGSSLQPNDAIARKSRMIYEFDAADVPGSHMYPPMAKFFRSQGVQVATQFQYDPLPLAPVNRNWMTHHLNLVCTPGKALSLAIAAEVFKRVPRGTPFGTLPEAAVFPPFRSSADTDLSELVTNTVFLYSNTTETQPPKPDALTRVWGCGRSPAAAYGGSGAYFLDRAAPGVWRFQLYPDIFTAADPYSGTSETKVYVIPGEHAMTLRLSDLGGSFAIRPFDGTTAGGRLAKARKGTFSVPPGDYLLTRRSGLPREADVKAAAALAPRYVAPAPTATGMPIIRADLPGQWRAGLPLSIRARTFAATNVTLCLTSPSGELKSLILTPTNETDFATEIPGTLLTPGVWRIAFRAFGPLGETVYPDARTLDAGWFPTSVAAVPLMDMAQATGPSSGLEPARGGVSNSTVTTVEGRSPGSRALRLTVDGIGDGTSAAGFTLPFLRSGATLGLTHAGLRVVTRGGPGGAKAELGFRMRNGQGLGCNLNVAAGWSETVVPAADLIPLWGLPSTDAFRWQDVTRISLLTGAWLLKRDHTDRQTIDVASVEWVQLEPAFPLNVADSSTPWSLFDADAWLRAPLWHEPLKRWRVSDDGGRPAIHLGTETFAGDYDSLSLRVTCDGKTFAQLWQTDGSNAVLHVRARATSPHTSAFELALIENGGVSWGTEVRLTEEWQTLHIPIRSLRLFTQWNKDFALQAGPHLRTSRLQSVNICFGKWLFREWANEPHSFEIAAIGITPD